MPPSLRQAWSANRQAKKNALKERFCQDLTGLATSICNHSFHGSDEQDSEILNTNETVDRFKRMLQDQVHHRTGIERRLDERCDRLDIEMAALKSYDPMQDISRLHARVDALENGIGAAFDRKTRELEALQGNYRDLRKELGIARGTVKSGATAVEVVERSLRDVAGKAANNEALMVRMEANLQGVAGRCLAVEGLFDAIQNLQGYVEAQQVNFDSVKGLQTSMDDCQRHCDKLEEHCVSLMESTCSLERQLQASGKSVKELYVLLDRHQSGLKDLIADEARARELDKCAVHDRFDALDRSHIEMQNLGREFGHHREHIIGALKNLATDMAIMQR